MSPRIVPRVLAALLTVTVFGCGAPDDSNQVVVYTSVDRIFSEPVLKAAETKHGFKVIGD